MHFSVIFPNSLAFINRRQASQRELDHILIVLAHTLKLRCLCSGVNLVALNLLVTICDWLRPFL